MEDLNRNFIGCDINLRAVEIGLKRVGQLWKLQKLKLTTTLSL